MRQLAAPFLALLAVLTTAVCADAARIRLPRPKRGLQMRMGKFTIPAAREREVCEFRTLPNRKSIDAQEFEFPIAGPLAPNSIATLHAPAPANTRNAKLAGIERWPERRNVA